MSDLAASGITPFRAGRLAGETRELAEAMPPDFGANVVLLADVSEFQPNIADAAYLSWSQAIVIRAAYGDAHDDHAWYGGARRADLLSGGAQFLGIYQYIVAGQDPVAQAKALVRILGGKLNKGEMPIADIEEGGGSQSGRWQSWANVIEQELQWSPWDYSGANFAATTGLAPVDWVAAYGQREPAGQHTLWQFSDNYQVPGIGTSDCSVFHGTIDELAAYAFGGSGQADWTKEAIMALPTLKEGAQDGTGTLFVHRIQNDVAGIGRWNKLGSVTALKDDGTFGPATTAGVKAIQSFFGITADGVVGRDTWTKLIGA